MRRALGISANGSRIPSNGGERHTPAAGNTSFNPAHARRHRFVQDGEVKVTVARRGGEHGGEIGVAAQAPVNRLDQLLAALNSEKLTREKAERSLEEAHATVRDLQTKLAHMELARDEAVAQIQALVAAAIEAVAVPIELERTIRRPRVPKTPEVETPQDESPQAEASPAEMALVEALPEAVAAPKLVAEPPVKRPVGRPRRVVAEGAAPPPKTMNEPKPVKWWLQSTKKAAKSPATGGRKPGRPARAK